MQLVSGVGLEMAVEMVDVAGQRRGKANRQAGRMLHAPACLPATALQACTLLPGHCRWSGRRWIGHSRSNMRHSTLQRAWA